jgi:acyl-CoA thioester hydrolase
MTNAYGHRFAAPDGVVDVNGHVNNVQYVQWMQDAAVRHSGSVGCTRLTESLGATWVIRSHRIKYLRPAFAEDVIDVLTWVADFRKVRSLRKYRFTRVSDGAVLAEGETDWVFVDAETGRPRVIPTEIRATFGLRQEDSP